MLAAQPRAVRRELRRARLRLREHQGVVEIAVPVALAATSVATAALAATLSSAVAAAAVASTAITTAAATRRSHGSHAHDDPHLHDRRAARYCAVAVARSLAFAVAGCAGVAFAVPRDTYRQPDDAASEPVHV